jgi:hypothetical protein
MMTSSTDGGTSIQQLVEQALALSSVAGCLVRTCGGRVTA